MEHYTRMTPEEKRLRQHAADARYRKKMKSLGRKRDRTEYNREYARKYRARLKALKLEKAE